jgi:hypothetical protein
MTKKKDSTFEVGEIIVDNVGAVDSFSDSLKKIVNAKATPEMVERMQGIDLLFGVKLDNIKDCMNAMMVVNALKGSEKAYELVAKMIHESPEETAPKQVQNNLFVLPDAVEMSSIANILSDDKHKVSYESIAGMKDDE